MTKRPIAIAALALAVLGLGACAKSEQAASQGESHAEAGFKHIHAGDGDAARGKELAVKKLAGGQACADCHGADGAKPLDATYPVLAGQYQDYLFHAIRQYRDGGREHALMGAQIKAAAEAGQMDDQAVADLAAYFASQTGPLGDLHSK